MDATMERTDETTANSTLPPPPNTSQRNSQRNSQHKRHWSDGETELLLRFEAVDESLEQIGIRLDRPANGCRNHLHRLITGRRECPAGCADLLADLKARRHRQWLLAEALRLGGKAQASDATHQRTLKNAPLTGLAESATTAKPQPRAAVPHGQVTEQYKAIAQRIEDIFRRVDRLIAMNRTLLAAVRVTAGVLSGPALAAAIVVGAVQRGIDTDDAIEADRIAAVMRQNFGHAEHPDPPCLFDVAAAKLAPNPLPPLVVTGPGGIYASGYTPGVHCDVEA